MKSPTNQLEPRPWGSLMALLAGCFATLIGIASGLQPHTILVRSAVSAVLFGILSTVAAAVLQRLAADEPSDHQHSR